MLAPTLMHESRDQTGSVPPSASPQPLPPALRQALRRTGTRPTRALLEVTVSTQRMRCLIQAPGSTHYFSRWSIPISTSRFGTGQVMNSNRTPLGLHRVAHKIGGGMPLGTVFKSRLPIGNLNQGMPEGGICHRILWLDGLEPGWNRGGEVDTRRRYIYIHGYYDEATLGRPASLGCVHVAAAHLLPLYDWLPKGALVWIQL